MQTINSQVIIVNAEGLIVGRMASIVAKKLLSGDKVIIVNAEKAVLSGKKKSRVAEAKEFLEVGSPGRGPLHYRQPDRILRKTVRGMLPFKQPKGKVAYRRLKVFIGVPEEFKGKSLATFEEAQAAKLRGPYFTLGELAKEIGWASE
ncbi:MAG: 50S ribosomal protein L13 [Candidatus Bathyarchaeota archaeon]|nr:50S ribosomal protein L13 [Candidatus Bathyarchaeota archaeon]